jgi:hypothetical protein
MTTPRDYAITQLRALVEAQMKMHGPLNTVIVNGNMICRTPAEKASDCFAIAARNEYSDAIALAGSTDFRAILAVLEGET